MNWEQPQYSLTEGSSTRVCAVHLQQTEKDFSIGITALPSQGKYILQYTIIFYFYTDICLTDFSIQDTQLNFPASTTVPQTSCTDVTAIVDGRLENGETFPLTLESFDPDITTGTAAVTLLIIEDISS